MTAEEQVSSRIASVGQQAAADAARLTVRVSGRLAEQLAGAGGWTVSKGVGAAKRHIDSGHMNERRLQRVAGGDIHELRLDRESLRAVSHSLKKAGLDFAIEHDGEDHYLHFRGRDLDHVQHAVSRAFRSIGLELDPDAITVQRTAPDGGPEARQALEQAGRHMPTHDGKADQSEPFTMIFNTVEWDRGAEIISNNLDHLHVPYTQDPGPGEEQQSFTFDVSYVPAVRSFIDSYAEKVEHFSTGRVDNYEQLCDPSSSARDNPEHAGPAETVPSPARMADPLEPDEPDQIRIVGTPRQAGLDRRQARGTATQHAAPSRSRTDAGNSRTGKEKPGQADKKGRDDFLAMLNKQTERKLTENRNAPKRVIEHRRGRS